MRRNWRAKVDGKGMSIVWSVPISRSDIKTQLIKDFCTTDVEVYE